MTTYRQVKGYSIKSVSSDPANIKEGQIWYNSSTKVVKVAPNVEAFGSAPQINTARYGGASGSLAPTDTAIGFCGYAPPVGPNYSGGRQQTEQYDGSSWSEVGDTNTGRYSCAGFGTSTAAIVVAGVNGPYPGSQMTNCEQYNGTSWTEVSDLNQTGGQFCGIGTATAGIVAGRLHGPSPGNFHRIGNTEEWDGSSWTEVADLNLARQETMGCGTQTAALVMGGQAPPVGTPSRTVNVEQWNGSSWTEIANLNQARGAQYNQVGTTSAGSCVGGVNSPPEVSLNNFERYDGTSWSAGPTLVTARYSAFVGGDNQNSIIIACGYNPASSPATLATSEQLTKGATTRTVDVS